VASFQLAADVAGGEWCSGACLRTAAMVVLYTWTEGTRKVGLGRTTRCVGRMAK
jgi:hypothetical protein